MKCYEEDLDIPLLKLFTNHLRELYLEMWYRQIEVNDFFNRTKCNADLEELISKMPNFEELWVYGLGNTDDYSFNGLDEPYPCLLKHQSRKYDIEYTAGEK